MNIYRILTFVAIVLLAIILRFLPHPYNFTPVIALCLFGGAYFGNKLVAFLTPLIVMFLSDWLIQLSTGRGFYEEMWLIYGAFALITLLGVFMQNRVSAVRVLGSSIAGSLIFFLITNFALFYPETSATLGFVSYPHNLSGVIASYTAGLPFLQNALLGDIFYSVVFFGGFYWLEKSFSILKLA